MIELVPIGCGRVGCPFCGVREAQVVAAMFGLNATMAAQPPTHVVLTTTREWVPAETLREGWRQLSRGVRREVGRPCPYAWFREWTTGHGDRAGGVRRTHYHSTWNGLTDDEAEVVRCISRDVFARLTGAYSERAHGVQRVWDMGGLARYVAGLVGHHVKLEQAQPKGERRARRFGTSKGYYEIAASELRARARAAVRDERLAHRLLVAIAEGVPEGTPEWIVDDVLTERLEAARKLPAPRVVPAPLGFWERRAAADGTPRWPRTAAAAGRR